MHIGLTAGLQIFSMPPSDTLSIAQRAEAAGFESIWIPDHPVIPEAIPPQYPYNDTGEPPFNNNSPWLEPTSMLTFLAAGTTTLGLGTGIYIVPLRNPHLLARSLSTVGLAVERTPAARRGGRLDARRGRRHRDRLRQPGQADRRDPAHHGTAVDGGTWSSTPARTTPSAG